MLQELDLLRQYQRAQSAVELSEALSSCPQPDGMWALRKRNSLIERRANEEVQYAGGDRIAPEALALSVACDQRSPCVHAKPAIPRSASTVSCIAPRVLSDSWNVSEARNLFDD
jgi:hypothetical protein